MNAQPPRVTYHPTPIALEPRIMLDAAAVVTAQDAIAAATPTMLPIAATASTRH